MKKISAVLLCTLLIITGCVQTPTEEEVLQNDDTEQETSIVPSYQLSDENYKMILLTKRVRREVLLSINWQTE